ncbi:MAG: FHA domain-containing protein [Thermoleophilaceae bacterium]
MLEPVLDRAAAMPESPIAPHTSTPAELRDRIDAERRGTPFLVFRDSDGQQRLVDLREGGRLSIGRREDNHIALTWDRGVSRVHAELELVGGEWTMTDDGLSQNGSYINGARLVGRKRLHDGDDLRVGQTRLQFSSPMERDTQATSALASTVPDVNSLTEPQKNVLVALCRPFRTSGSFATPATNREIADELFLSVDAVKDHLRKLFQKFGIGEVAQNQKRAQLVWRAFQTGIVNARDLWPENGA